MPIIGRLIGYADDMSNHLIAFLLFCSDRLLSGRYKAFFFFVFSVFSSSPHLSGLLTIDLSFPAFEASVLRVIRWLFCVVLLLGVPVKKLTSGGREKDLQEPSITASSISVPISRPAPRSVSVFRIMWFRVRPLSERCLDD